MHEVEVTCCIRYSLEVPYCCNEEEDSSFRVGRPVSITGGTISLGNMRNIEGSRMSVLQLREIKLSDETIG